MKIFGAFAREVIGIKRFFFEGEREMRAPAMEKELGKLLVGNAGDPSEIESELDEAERIEGFFDLELVGVHHEAIGAADLVFNGERRFFF